MLKYLNTDLDIETAEDLSPLVPVFEETCIVLHAEAMQDGRWMIRVEADRLGESEEAIANPERDIELLLEVLRNFDTESKKMLRHAALFDFNIGWESGKELPPSSFRLSTELLGKISEIGATLTITIYPTEDAYPKSDLDRNG